jgi:hypothetical protein
MKLISHLIERVRVRPSVRFLTIASLLLSGVCIGTTEAALADNCKNVSIKLVNKNSSVITLQKVEYMDFGKNKFRTEFMFGLDGIQSLGPNQAFTKVQNLEFVGNETTFFRITYLNNVFTGQTQHIFTSPVFTCTNNIDRTVLLENEVGRY